MKIHTPMCEDCGAKVELMLSVRSLIGETLTIDDIIPELCPLCKNVMMHNLRQV